MESLLQGLNREQRIGLAEKVIRKYEAMLGSAREVAAQAVERHQSLIEAKGVAPTINDLSFVARDAVASASENWYEWVKTELLQFNSNETKEALNRLGLGDEG
jgi:hypothetical protein